jgi:hypothetical protein
MRSRPALFRPLIAGALLFVAGCQDIHDPTTPIAAPDEAALAQGPAAQDLAAWFVRASPEVLALPFTVFADHDESANRLVFGVERGSAVFGVQRALSALRIPAAAYEIRIVEPIHFASTLRSEHRPTMGGLQIHWSGYVCTLGFSVDHAGGRSFITNSHCTDQQGTTGNTQYNQPTRTISPDPIGFEAHDPAYTRGGGCSPGKVCRFSDAARALYEPGIESKARIAKTTGENNGSLDVAGYFTITSQDNSTTHFSTGTTIHKVGRTTGWTSGPVTNTCVTVNVSGSNIQLRCQTMVQSSGSVLVGGGDSGSGVFRRTSGDNVQLVGILWGGSTSGDRFVFSPLKNIQDELGTMNATTDGVGGNGGGGGGGGEDPAPCVPRGPNGNNCK